MRFSGLSCAFVLLISTSLLGCTHTPQAAKQTNHIGDKVANVAKQMVGTRYRFGGNHPKKGFDCSGLVQYSYKSAGVKVARSTQLQKRNSRLIAPGKMQKGDLLFFNQLGKRMSHVGIYIGNNKFVHAPSSGKYVRIDSLKTDYWRKHLASIRRFTNL
ncbi:MAG: C40 family peptidase [Gammaproteobacteria bacterium]|nr:C40 family peptidase [Gammaproteobacteria bacterium]